ncbi:GTP-binding protein [Micromonospora thermarum]|uniref:GTP-binding protein n=1 Tax=Micromonospora thermarum TaxID=2720024 RepID=A0ABX0Z4X0_9ACTN|nr:GTP-binding protein [Micromonospora thermarum]NJP32890.1 GTP-binding protein [Micromonospora thermarum]
METVNIGILAHVDAGKTSLTERLLFDTGVIDRLGSVDAGTTRTDTGEIERRRGITIRSAVVAFTAGGRQVNLVDTPGHSDFVAEVERALGVLDGAVLVLSAVEGVQPHTRVLMRTLRSLRLPTLLFVNKVDRAGARTEPLVAEIRRLLTPGVVPMGTVRGAGTPAARVEAYDQRDPAAVVEWATVLADHDDELLADLVEERAPDPDRVAAALRAQTAAGLACPLLFGSAITGAGVPALVAALGDLLPPAPPAEPDLRARVFAVERTERGEKVALVRSYGGELARRQRVTVHRREPDGRLGRHRARVTGVTVVGAPDTGVLTAGRIARLHGLPGARIGDQLGTPENGKAGRYFPPPTLETVIRARRPEQAEALHAALLDLADADPLIRTRPAPGGGTGVLLYGDVQREVLAATLAGAYGVEAEFTPGDLVHVERLVGAGEAVEIIGNGFLGTVGLRVEPGEGVTYRLAVELGSLPLSFHAAIEETVFAALDQGVHGWPVTDVAVTLTHSGYWSPVSTAGDFRDLTPYVLMQALARAGTRVHEPCHRFDCEVPADTLGPVTAYLARVGGRVDGTEPGGDTWHVTGEVPARCEAQVRRRLPDLTRGEGLWSSVPHGDRLVVGEPPRRPRSDGNPFDRVEYTRFLAQRQLAATAGR